jgi:hypothetical protein
MIQPRHVLRNALGLFATALAIGLLATPSILLAQTGSAAVAPQSSTDRGVTVKVTPKSIGSAAGPWEFSVVLDTHSADLNDDLTQNATLLTDDGRTLKPLSWNGAAPGGHHREGVLSFEVPAPVPREIELRITRPGEAAARSFRWQF